MSAAVQQNRIYYRSNDPPSLRLLGILRDGGCIGYFRLECCDKRRPPAAVQYYPSMYIVGATKLLVGAEAFEHAQSLVNCKKQQTAVVQHTTAAYQAKLLEVKQRFANGNDGPLGFSDREMGSFSDAYALVAQDGYMPQTFQTANKTGAPEDQQIITPDKEMFGKMSQEEQSQRLKMMEGERSKQDGYFKSVQETDRELKLRQVTGGGVPQQQQTPVFVQPAQFPQQFQQPSYPQHAHQFNQQYPRSSGQF